MDATEITNNEYRQFVLWVRDSTAATLMQYEQRSRRRVRIDWKKTQTIKWNDKATTEKIDQLIPDSGKPDFRQKIDPSKLVYHSETFDLKEAAKKANEGKVRSQFMVKKDIKIYPDTLVWVRDFSYSYYEPLTKRYFSTLLSETIRWLG